MGAETPNVDPLIKRTINEEGFEGNAAVLIGKRNGSRQEDVELGNSGNDEMGILEQRLESEGKTVDLATYIRLNKTISIPTEFLEKVKFRNIASFDEIKRKFPKGSAAIFGDDDEGANLSFLDSGHNLASIRINYEKISSLNNLVGKSADSRSALKEALEALGFTIFNSKVDFWQDIDNYREVYKRGLENEAREKKVNEFDF